MRERGDSLLKQTQKMCQIVLKHVLFMKAKRSTLEIKNMDFRNPGLPHSVVKHTSVRELIQKIEIHPDRHALQQDLRQNQAYNPFSPESKKMLQDVGTHRTLWIARDGTQNAVHSMPVVFWNICIVYCTCGHLLQKETAVNGKFVEKRWTFFHSQNTSSRREDLMATDMGKSQETKNIIRLTN